MTYQDLKNQLSRLTPEQLQMDVTISLDISQEAIPASTGLYIIGEDDFLGDVLDVGHPVIPVDF